MGLNFPKFIIFVLKKAEKTASYAHKQAGAAKRINLTLLNKIRALLFTAKFPIKFWAEALNAVVYLYNNNNKFIHSCDIN